MTAAYSGRESLIYPSLKNGCKVLGDVRADIMDSFGVAACGFTVEERFSGPILDMLAYKYKASLDDYPENDNDEHLLLGPAACAEALKSAAGAGLARIEDFLFGGRSKLSRKKIWAIYVLGIDNSDENRQQFLLFTPDGIWLRDDSLAMNFYRLNAIRFREDGISLREDETGILEWEFDPRFIRYVEEVCLLRSQPVRNIPTRHPFCDELARTGEAGAGRKAGRYMKLLCMAACSGGILNVETLLRLERMAETFHLRQDVFYSLLAEVFRNSPKPNLILAALNEALGELALMPAEVLYTDILEVCAGHADDSGALVGMLSRDKFAGRDFVNNCLQYFKHELEAEKHLGRCFAAAKGRAPEALVAQRQHSGAINLYLMKNNTKIYR